LQQIYANPHSLKFIRVNSLQKQLQARDKAMNPCVFCGEIFRIEQQRCPHCGETNNVPPALRSRFDRIQLTIKLGRLKGDAAARFEAETLGLLKQDMGLADIVQEIERLGNGRYAGSMVILRNLSGLGDGYGRQNS
jgi:hypothetical protein